MALPGATDTERKRNAGLRHGSGSLVLVVIAVAVLAADMVVNVLYDRAAIGMMMSTPVTRAIVPPWAMAPTTVLLVKGAAFVMLLLVMVTVAVITARPGAA
jgi:hypothetical protein